MRPQFVGQQNDNTQTLKGTSKQTSFPQSQSKTPFQSFPQKNLYNQSIDEELDDLPPPLVQYRGDDNVRFIDVNQYLPAQREKEQQKSNNSSQPQSTSPFRPSQLQRQNTIAPQKDVEKNKINPQFTQQNSQIMSSDDNTPSRRRSKQKFGFNDELRQQEQSVKPEDNHKKPDQTNQHQPIQQKPLVKEEQETDPKKKYESDKLIETFLKSASPNLTYIEIENLSDAMVEKQIQKHDDEKIGVSNKIKQLRTEQKALPKNDIRIKYMEQEINLMSDKLLLIEKVINLFKDKLTLRNQVHNQKNLLNQLASRVVRMDTEFTEQIHQLKTYNASLPTERERKLELNIKKLQQQMDQEKKLREELEGAVAVNIGAFQSLFSEATEAKQHILDQLKEVKAKKEVLENLQKTLDEQALIVQKQGHNQGVAKPQFGNQGQDPRQSFHQGSLSSNSSRQHVNQGQPVTMGSHLSKFIQRTVAQPQQESSFSRNQSGKGEKEQPVLQLLNAAQLSQSQNVAQGNQPQQSQVTSKVTTDGKKPDSLATIKENDISSPQSMNETLKDLDNNTNKINSMLKTMNNANKQLQQRIQD